LGSIYKGDKKRKYNQTVITPTPPSPVEEEGIRRALDKNSLFSCYVVPPRRHVSFLRRHRFAESSPKSYLHNLGIIYRVEKARSILSRYNEERKKSGEMKGDEG
jgi:hypothetical protein